MNETVNKDILANEIAEDFSLSKAESRRIVDFMFNRMTSTLASGGEVSIFGFGKFNTKHRSKRKGFNPSTKESMTIEASTVATFQPAKALRDEVDKLT